MLNETIYVIFKQCAFVPSLHSFFSSIDLLKNGVDAKPGWNGCNVTNNPALHQLSLIVAQVTLF